jgi:hypothetical protein
MTSFICCCNLCPLCGFEKYSLTVINSSLSTPYDHSGATEILTLNSQNHWQLYMLPPTACVWQHRIISCTLFDIVFFFIKPISQF